MADRAIPGVPAVGGTGVFDWISTLTPKERSAFGAARAAGPLDAMDVQMYSFVIPTLIATWGITRGQAGALGTAALSRFGRRRMAGGLGRRPLRPRAHAATGHRVVRRFHISIGRRAKLSATVSGARAPGSRLRRRMGRRGGVAGRSHAARTSRQGPGIHAGGLGCRVGARRRCCMRCSFRSCRRRPHGGLCSWSVFSPRSWCSSCAATFRSRTCT